MEITHYTTSTIVDFTVSEQFRKLKNIPITPQRALSYSLNPRAEADDKILFVAWEKGEMVGYIGALTDRIMQTGTKIKFAWLSCFWIAPEFRGKGLSAELLRLAMHSWDNKALITNMAPGTTGIYMKSGLFRPLVSKEGIRCFLRFNLATILPPKKKMFRRIRPVLEIMDFSLNLVNSVRLLFFRKTGTADPMVPEIIPGVVDDTGAFISRLSRQELIQRGKAELNWILENRWMIEGNGETEDSRRYYFSLVSKRFSYRCIKFLDDQREISGFMILAMRNDHLKVPCFYGTADARPSMRDYIITTMMTEGLSMVTVFHPELTEVLKQPGTPFITKRKILHSYLASHELEISAMSFQDGDGDTAFT